MAKLIQEQQVTKEQALDGIMEVLTRFDSLLLNIRDKPKLTAGSELYRFADFIINKNYSSAFRKLNWTIFDNLSSEGYEKFLLKCKTISDKYELEVTIPRNIKVLGEGIIEDFITDLTQDAFDAIARNRTELIIEKTVLLEQVGQLDFNDEKYTKLEWIIKSKQAFNVAKAENDRATEEITNLACSHQIDGYEPWYKMQKESEKRMQAIITECPFVIFFSGKSDAKKVEKEINALVKKINSGLDGVEEKIRNGTYPIWELTPLISNLLKKDKYQGKEEVILKEFDKWRSDKYKKDLFFTIGSIVLSVAGLLIPGGCSFGLLLAKAVTTTAGAAMGIAQSVDEFTQAGINKDTAYASLRLSDDQIALVENADVSEATKEYILSGVFLGLGIFDVADSVKSVKLIFKLDKLDDVTRLALKNSKRFGAKAFQNCDVDSLTKIGKNLPEPHAIEIFNMKNTVNVVDSLGTKAKPKVFANLSSLEAPKVPVALDFFPNNLNTNIIWLGMDFNNAPGNVLTSSKSAIKKYNDVLSNSDLLIQITDTEQTVVNKANALLKYEKLSNAERVALLREMNIGNSTIQKNTVFIRLTQGYYPDLTVNTKEFAWVTDPYILMGKSDLKELMEGIGYSYNDAVNTKKLYMDVIIFDKPENVKKLIEPKVIDWDKIRDITFDKLSKEYESLLKSGDLDDIKEFKKIYPNLVVGNKIDKTLLEQNYIRYYREKLPGVKLEGEIRFENMTDFFKNQIGANEYFTGSGVTVSDRAGIGSNEFALTNNDCKFNVEQINRTHPGTCHIVRLETDDTGMFILKK